MLRTTDLTIIVPAYNVASYIDACMASLIEAGGRDCPVIVVDDGSRDETMAKLQSWRAEFPDLTLVLQRNQGQGAARNAGLRLARSSHVMFVDSDDWLRPRAIDELLPRVAPDIDILFSGRSRFQERTGRYDRELIFPDLARARVPQVPHVRSILAVHGKVFRRAFLEGAAITFPEGMVWEDIVHSCQTYREAQWVAATSVQTYVWRVRSAEENPSTMQSLLTEKSIRDRFRQVALTLEILDSAEWRRRWPKDDPLRTEFVGSRVYMHVRALVASGNEAAARPAMALIAELTAPYWPRLRDVVDPLTLEAYAAVRDQDLPRLKEVEARRRAEARATAARRSVLAG